MVEFFSLFFLSFYTAKCIPHKHGVYKTSNLAFSGAFAISFIVGFFLFCFLQNFHSASSLYIIAVLWDRVKKKKTGVSSIIFNGRRSWQNKKERWVGSLTWSKGFLAGDAHLI
jgi:hypothetical protein